MELLSPAGNLEKLKYAYLFGADAAYIGVKDFSLRTKADNFREREYEDIRGLKGGKKLYCALNISFHNGDIRRLESELDYFDNYPFDAFIISDIGTIPVLRRRFPEARLHLSTQANCTNAEAARMYRDLGFSRIILGRELSLDEAAEIKAKVPEIEIELFVHGAMCLAYSGRCFLSSWMAGRSGNKGHCSHSCRWNYRVLEEAERPGEYYPVFENEGFTTILSSRDLCLIDHLADFQKAGIDSLKIEGRMKSLYYTALVTRAYRKQLDALAGKPVPDLALYRDDVFKVSHREYCTGFYFGRTEVEKHADTSYREHHVFLGMVGKEVAPGLFELDLRNKLVSGRRIEYAGPDVLFLADDKWELFDKEGRPVPTANHGHEHLLRPGVPDIGEGFLIRSGAQSV